LSRGCGGLFEKDMKRGINKGNQGERGVIRFSEGGAPATPLIQTTGGKPALAGSLPIASVSAPAPDGVRDGEKAGLASIELMRGGRFNCCGHPQRIKAPADLLPA